MGTIRNTVTLDGVAIAKGSLLAVALYEENVRAALTILNGDAEIALGIVPDEVEDTWRKKHRKLVEGLLDQAAHVHRFGRDLDAKGLEWAVREAKFRKELP